jgi:hypothetical protein
MTVRSRGLRWLLVGLLAAWPAGAGAFSFLPGGFAPGEQILSVQLASSSGSVPTISFDTSTNTLLFDAEVSTITTNLATYDIALGDVVFQSTVMLLTETVFAPVAPVFGGLIEATFTNGMVADFSILDIGPGGVGALLDANYDGSLFFNAGPSSFGLPVSGSLDGDFTVLGGNAGFLAAFGSAGNYFANLSNFLSNGNPVGSDLCNMIVSPCSTSGQIANFTVNPAATIVPTATPVPEPALAWLLAGAGLLACAKRRFAH